MPTPFLPITHPRHQVRAAAEDLPHVPRRPPPPLLLQLLGHGAGDLQERGAPRRVAAALAFAGAGAGARVGLDLGVGAVLADGGGGLGLRE